MKSIYKKKKKKNFTRGSGSWNRVHPSPRQESFIDSFDIDFKHAVFTNGTIHWIYDNVKDHYDAYSYPRKYILVFDMVEEKLERSLILMIPLVES
jgi:hypothetical protein